jgi:hypothetical protein
LLSQLPKNSDIEDISRATYLHFCCPVADLAKYLDSRSLLDAEEDLPKIVLEPVPYECVPEILPALSALLPHIEVFR